MSKKTGASVVNQSCRSSLAKNLLEQSNLVEYAPSIGNEAALSILLLLCSAFFDKVLLIHVTLCPLLLCSFMKSLLTPALLTLSAGGIFAVDFKKDIQPILKAECYKCHSEEAKKEKAGYVFDNLTRLAKDIGPGRAIVPGDLRDSHFFSTLVSPEEADAHMPPEKTLKDEEIKLIREWILAGAPLDGEGTTPMADNPAPTTPAPAATPAMTPVPAVETPAAPVLQKWTNTSGVVIEAEMVRLEGENVILKKADGTVFPPYPLNKLTPESQAQAKASAAQ